jgi:hypothetical protein
MNNKPPHPIVNDFVASSENIEISPIEPCFNLFSMLP